MKAIHRRGFILKVLSNNQLFAKRYIPRNWDFISDG
jgi:hypothetical protein